MWSSRPFWNDKMERISILRRSRPRVSNILSRRIVGYFKINDFRHSWKVPSSTNDPWTSRWVLGFFVNTRSFWLNGLRRKSILENDTPKHICGKLENQKKTAFSYNMASFFMHFCGPHTFFGKLKIQLGNPFGCWSLNFLFCVFKTEDSVQSGISVGLGCVVCWQVLAYAGWQNNAGRSRKEHTPNLFFLAKKRSSFFAAWGAQFLKQGFLVQCYGCTKLA